MKPVTAGELRSYVHAYRRLTKELADLNGYFEVAAALKRARDIIDHYTARLDAAPKPLKDLFTPHLQGQGYATLRDAIIEARARGAWSAVRLMEQGQQIPRDTLIWLGLGTIVHRPGNNFNLFKAERTLCYASDTRWIF